MFYSSYKISPGFRTIERLQTSLRRRSPLNPPKIVISNAEVKRAIKALGRRVMTMHRRLKLVKQLKAEKMSEQE